MTEQNQPVFLDNRKEVVTIVPVQPTVLSRESLTFPFLRWTKCLLNRGTMVDCKYTYFLTGQSDLDIIEATKTFMHSHCVYSR